MKKPHKINYNKLNFGLSLIGFMGSLTFYFNVLKGVNATKPTEKIISELRAENLQLQKQLDSCQTHQNNKYHESIIQTESTPK